MRLTLFLLVITAASSCGHENNTASTEKIKPVTIKLIDSLGSVSISLPVRYDTFFTWTDYGDCGRGCNYEKYRYQPKRLPITEDGGFYWAGEPRDSIEKFTISHLGYFPFQEGDERYITMHRKWFVAKQPQYFVYEAPITLDTLERINGRLFSLIVASSYDTTLHQTLKRVVATTTIKNNEIRFYFELLTKEHGELVDNFVGNAIACIRTIKIEKGI